MAHKHIHHARRLVHKTMIRFGMHDFLKYLPKFLQHGGEDVGVDPVSKRTDPKKQSSFLPKSKRFIDFVKYVDLAGYTQSFKQIHEKIIHFSLILTLAFFFIYTIYLYLIYDSLWAAIISNIIWIFVAAPVAYVGTWLGFYVVTDFRISGRRESIEKALPDYLQLAASNIRAGLPIDRALWLAIRPRFGILAFEMEMVAKQTMSGERLEVALDNFAKKYDSAILHRTISLIREGLRAGSEVGALLENISNDITDMYQRRDNMAANVTQYLIFIQFAVAVAAPLLFGMSIQLLSVLNTIGGQISAQQSESTGTSASTFSLELSGNAVNETHFFIFCVISLLSSAFFSSLIISNIKNGNGRDVVKMAPVIAIISLALFLISSWGLSLLFADLI